jgi:hypothetical protein
MYSNFMVHITGDWRNVIIHKFYFKTMVTSGKSSILSRYGGGTLRPAKYGGADAKLHTT